MERLQQIFKSLSSEKKLERDHGVQDFQNYLNDVDPEQFESLSEFLLNKLDSPRTSWETVYANLTACKLLIPHPWSKGSFYDAVLKYIQIALDDDEYRARIAAGDTLGELCKKCGDAIYSEAKQLILDGIRGNLERRSTTSSESGQDSTVDDSLTVISSSPRTHALMFEEGNAQILHDTAGWKHLETWMKCLQSAIDGCGTKFNDHIDQELLDLVFTALNHTNRFVRETGYQVCASLVACNSHCEQTRSSSEDHVYTFGMQFAEHLADGLADNWSQVRLAGSVAVRQFMLALDKDTRHTYFPLLLPRMCLNRYYVAEGVRIYSQETWRQIADSHGKDLVRQFINPTVEFYINQSEADNHAVREAACACISELGAKIDADSVRPHVPRLLAALLTCFEDDSWPVRDAACIACGNFITCFPDESKQHMEELTPLFYENLQDNIPSVRSGAAEALRNVATAYGSDVIPDMIKRIEINLKGISSQDANAERYAGIDKAPATFSVTKKARDNDPDLHSDQTMYSCGSLAPKMGRGGGKDKGGCMHATFRRAAEPWEKAEGSVHLFANLAVVPSTHQDLAKLLPALAQAASYRDYTQHVVFLETLCKRLPEIGKELGKRLFKPHLELFFDGIFYSLMCDNALTSSAASQCLNHLSNFLGPNILRGRVENYNPRLLESLEANIVIAPM